MMIHNPKINFNEISFKIDKLANKYTPKNWFEIKNYFKVKGIKGYFFKKISEIIDSSQWLKPIYEDGYFKPEKNPHPYKLINHEGYRIPVWSELKFLEKIAVDNVKAKDKKIEKDILKIINEIISYKNKKNKRIDNYFTDLAILKILYTLPTCYIKDLHLRFIKEALDNKYENGLFAWELCTEFIPKLIKDQAKNLLLRLLEIILTYKKEIKGLSDEYKPIIEEHRLKVFLNKNIKDLANLCGKEASLICINKIEEILKKDKHEFDIYSIWTIKDEKKPRSSDSYKYQIVKFARDIYEQSNPDAIKEDIFNLLNKKNFIFKRLASHILNYHYKELSDLFWQTWQDKNPLDNYQLKPEIYELFKNNCTLFDKKQIMMIIDWINTKDYKEKSKEAKAYRKKEWLETLLKTNDSKVLKEYERNKKINPNPVIYPGKVIWMDTYWDKSVSPFTSQELLEKTNEQISQHLIDFKEEKALKKPTQEGLEDSLRKSITEDPGKYTEDLQPFFKLPLSYHRIILQGLNSAWRENKSFYWENVFDYVLAIIDTENDNYRDFWKAEYKKGQYNYQNSIITEIANLIHEGTKNDDHAFDKKHLLIAEKILLILLKNAKSDLDSTGDLHTKIINSFKNDIFSAMIVYSLRYARTNPDLSTEDRWKKEIKEEFTDRLGKETPEFYFTLGQYFLNLYYLNKEWVQENINKIFYKEDILLWRSSIIGYFSHIDKVYLEIYNLFKKNNILLDALNYRFSEKHVNDIIVQNICIGYMEDWEKLEDPNSLISKILEDKKEYQIAEVVRFVEMFHEKLNDKRKQKIKPLWKRIFSIISENEEKPDFQNIATDLIDWLNLIDKIDEDIFNWLKLSVKYIDQYNPDMVYQKYYERIDKNPEKIGKLILEMLKYKIPATYDIKEIIKTVESLYSKGQKVIANEICNIYGENGYYFLKDTFNRYNKI